MGSQAAKAIEQYLARTATGRRTRFTPAKGVETQRDPKLSNVVFYRYPDGSNIRLDTGKVSRTGMPSHDIQEF